MSTTNAPMLGSAPSSISKPLPDLPTGAASFVPSNRLSYTIAEAAAATGLTKRKIEGAILRGELKHKIVGNTAIIPASSLKRLVGELP
jgi:excisionase family DNA binding protein